MQLTAAVIPLLVDKVAECIVDVIGNIWDILVCLSMECGSLVHLLTAQRCIQHLQFLPALRSLYDAHLKLASWASNIGLKEVCMSVCACVAYTLAMLISFVLFAWLCQAHKTTISYAVSKYTVVHTCNLSVQTLNMHEIKVSHLE